MKERKKHPILFAIMLVLFIVAVIFWIWTKNGGPKINKVTGEKTVNYSSISDMISGDEVKLPSIVDVLNDDVKCTRTGNTYQILESSGKYLLRFTESGQYYFAIDPFELEGANQDEKNFVENNSNGIRYVRYRNGCLNFENCTAINWDDTKYTYSIIIGTKLDKNKALEVIGVKTEELREFVKPHFAGEDVENNGNTYELTEPNKENELGTVTTEINTSEAVTTSVTTTLDTSEIPTETTESTSEKSSDTSNENLDSNITDFENKANKVSIDFPNTSTEIVSVAYPGAVMYSMGGKIIVAVVYDKSSDIFSESNEIKIKNNMVVRYLSENPFDMYEQPQLYSDYEKIYNSMASIANSVKVENDS